MPVCRYLLLEEGRLWWDLYGLGGVTYNQLMELELVIAGVILANALLDVAGEWVSLWKQRRGHQGRSAAYCLGHIVGKAINRLLSHRAVHTPAQPIQRGGITKD